MSVKTAFICVSPLMLNQTMVGMLSDDQVMPECNVLLSLSPPFPPPSYTLLPDASYER